MKWIPYSGTLERFEDDGLFQPGTVLFIEGQGRVVIGDVNERGGECDCCDRFAFERRKLTVVKYAVIPLPED